MEAPQLMQSAFEDAASRSCASAASPLRRHNLVGARCYFLMAAAAFTAMEAKRRQRKKEGTSSPVIACVFKERRTVVSAAAGVITMQESQKARLCVI